MYNTNILKDIYRSNLYIPVNDVLGLFHVMQVLWNLWLTC